LQFVRLLLQICEAITRDVGFAGSHGGHPDPWFPGRCAAQMEVLADDAGLKKYLEAVESVLRAGGVIAFQSRPARLSRRIGESLLEGGVQGSCQLDPA